jgi:hypothetical protein
VIAHASFLTNVTWKRKFSKEQLMNPISLAGVGESQSVSRIAIKQSIYLCRQTDIIVERLTQPVIAVTPILPGTLEQSPRAIAPEDWTKESILKLIRGSGRRIIYTQSPGNY